jgi:hypothetical protein
MTGCALGHHLSSAFRGISAKERYNPQKIISMKGYERIAEPAHSFLVSRVVARVYLTILSQIPTSSFVSTI